MTFSAARIISLVTRIGGAGDGLGEGKGVGVGVCAKAFRGILVTANPAPAAVVAKKGDDRPWGLRDALDDAAHNLASTVGALVRGVGIALPFAVLALAIWLGVRIVRRTSRRGEAPEEGATPG